MVPQKTTATLFIDKDSWVERLHPFTKLSYILFTGAAVYAGPSGWKAAGLLLMINGILAVSAGIHWEICRTLGRIMLPLMLIMIPIHGFFYPPNKSVLASAYGITLYQEGALFAAITLAKLTVVLTASLTFVFSTHPADLITAITLAGNSPSLAFLIGSPLLLLAAMRQRIEVIQAAQRARGLETDGNLFRRFCSLAPLIIPLVVGAIVEVEQRSIALEVRGFRSAAAKTSLRILADSTLQRLVRWLMVAIVATFILQRWIR